MAREMILLSFGPQTEIHAVLSSRDQKDADYDDKLITKATEEVIDILGKEK